MDEFEILFTMNLLGIVLILAGITILWRVYVSLTAQLTAAVDRVVNLLQNPPVPANVTPDSEVQTQIDRLNNANFPTQPTA